MGWTNESRPNCEGYLVGLTPVTRPDGSKSPVCFRELSGEAGDHPGQEDWPLDWVQMGCECGWRSKRLRAPRGTVWVPFAVVANAAFEDDAYQLWREHIEQENSREEAHASAVGSLK